VVIIFKFDVDRIFVSNFFLFCVKDVKTASASGLVVKSDVAIVGPRVRFSAGAHSCFGV